MGLVLELRSRCARFKGHTEAMILAKCMIRPGNTFQFITSTISNVSLLDSSLELSLSPELPSESINPESMIISGLSGSSERFCLRLTRGSLDWSIISNTVKEIDL